MKRIVKFVVAILLLASIPSILEAQTPYRQYSDEGVVLNFHEINNVYFRAFLLYTISHDNRFVLIPEEKFGQFILTSKDDDNHFMDEFESFFADAETDFSLLSKMDITNQMSVWKSSVEAIDYLSIMMDVNTANLRADNDHCLNSMPFCTSEVIEFEAAYEGGATGEPGPDYGCLSSQPYPSWYHMRIHTAGQFIIHMEAHDASGQGNDIDYCIWGPFANPHDPCVADLTCEKLIDCSYSTASVEDVYLGYPISQHDHPNLADGSCVISNNNPPHVPEVGEYYILMITNFAQVQQTISFTKAPNSGPGETDCDILPGIVNNGGPYCVGETIQLTVNEQFNASYAWVGPDGWTSDLQNPTRENCTMSMAGTYECTTTVGTQSVSASTQVIIYPQPSANFDFTSVCLGNATQFTSTSTTNPSGQAIASYEWDFGDGQTGSGENVSHTYDQFGDYEVTLRTFTGAHCFDEKILTVPVYAVPVATVSANPSSVIYGGTATLTAIVDTPGDYTFHWEPANMVTNPNSQTTQTVPIQESQVFTVTIINTQGGCTSTEQVVVSMAGSNLTATATADQYEICENGSTTLHALPLNGTGIYTYRWTPEGLLNDPNIQNPVATPPVGTTTFTCTVDDGLTTQNVTVSIVVLPKDEMEISETTCDQFYWDPEGHTIVQTDHSGNIYEASGSYQRTYLNQFGCDSIVKLDLTVNYKSIDNDTIVDGNETELCDSFLWQFGWNGETFSYDKDTTVTKRIETAHGCDSIVTLTIRNMKYTPRPEIICMDDVEWPHNPITATEFNVNHYNYTAKDPKSDFTWQYSQCEWSLSKDSWRYVPSDDNHSCTVYAMDWVEDTVWLYFKAVSPCSEDGVIAKYWLKSSFYGIDDMENDLANVSIIPNPNNGQMELRFENMEGRIQVKVCDATGMHIDSFEIPIIGDTYTYNYTMSRFSDGVYFFLITDGKRNLTKKVVVIH